MFAIVNTCEEKRSHAKKNPITSQRIDLGREKYVFIINVPVHKGRIPVDKLRIYAGSLKNSLIFPNDKARENDTLSQLRLFNSSVKLLTKDNKNPRDMSLCLYDKEGLYIEKAEFLVPLAVSLHIICPERGKYASFTQRMLFRYGASVSVSSQWNHTASMCNTVITADSDIVPLHFKGRVFSDKSRVIPDASFIVGKGICLPYFYESLRPFGVDKLIFASALYEKCEVKEAEHWEYEKIIGY